MPLSHQEKKREHALKNEEACLYLNESGKFPDWVITTAFYSALQFVKYKAFPLTIEETTFNIFDEYCTFQINTNNYCNSPHDALRLLVTRHLRVISTSYLDLHNLCHNSRYTDYDVDQKDVEIALQNLADIKKYCNTEKPKPKKKRKRITKRKT